MSVKNIRVEHMRAGTFSSHVENVLIEIFCALVMNVAFVSWTGMLMAQFQPTSCGQHSFEAKSFHLSIFHRMHVFALRPAGLNSAVQFTLQCGSHRLNNSRLCT